MMMIMMFLSQPVMAYCRFWDSRCVDPIAQTTSPMSLKPLFPDPLILYYAFDSTASGSSNGEPYTKSAFWFRYGRGEVNSSVITTNRTWEIGMRMGNFTGQPSGGHNGCDGIVGSRCAESIEETLQSSIYQLLLSGGTYSNPLQSVLDQMQDSLPSNFSCVPSFFDVQQFPVICEFLEFFAFTCNML